MRYGAKSDKGRVREKNEDNYNILSAYPGIPATFVIADGMGGHHAGEVASKTAVESIGQYILQNPGSLDQEEKILHAIEEMMMKANGEVFHKSKEKEEYYGMGTTLITAIVVNKKLFLGHVGDSRAYRIRNGSMEQLTTDHSYIEELVKNGTITREEAKKHPKKNIITRALGCFESLNVDTYDYDIMKEDIFLLCTDGLTNSLPESEIKSIVLNTKDPQEACDQLVARANEEGGEDNITVIVFKEV